MAQKTILYIDDDTDDREMFALALKETGLNYDLVLAKDGIEGIEILTKSETPFFLIICDTMMPKLDGNEVLKTFNTDTQLKEKKIPFILITGQKDPKQISDAFKNSIQGFFKKGSGFDETVSLISILIAYWERAFYE